MGGPEATYAANPPHPTDTLSHRYRAPSLVFALNSKPQTLDPEPQTPNRFWGKDSCIYRYNIALPSFERVSGTRQLSSTGSFWESGGPQGKISGSSIGIRV